MKWSALINPVTRDAPRTRLHLSSEEALDAYILLPIALAFLIGWTIGRKSESTADVPSEHHHVPDTSLKRIKSGRFLIFDPHHNAEKVKPLERAMKKYPNIQVPFDAQFSGRQVFFGKTILSRVRVVVQSSACGMKSPRVSTDFASSK
ncbi:hypothetical protein Y032_0033g2695 [Ancylostoma ceylanicum]|uniref:Uncharacterized protein n=1 Tax=Ancylostoma ceylanicum TaxID=53326 RepID=A0A016UMV1_9BILA|nr:hypothetical protein Y032_0033g2695 [Ancylostoma ceylanicum]